MRIVEQSVEIVMYEGINGYDILEHLERVGRTCYKSEGLIKEGSAVKFIGGIVKSGHTSVLEHASLTVRFITSRDVTHQIVRHRTGCSYCVDGDTVIRSIGDKSWTISQLYEWQEDYRRSGNLKKINVRSVDEETNKLVANHIKQVFKTGVKPCYEVTTASGRSIVCTDQHRFYTPEGYIKLQYLTEGDMVYSNGLDLLDNKDWLYDNYIVKNRTRKDLSKEIGCCESLVHRAFKKFEIKKSKKDYPNRQAGHGIKGMHGDEGRKQISERMKGSGNHKYYEDRGDLTNSGGYCEVNRMFPKEGRYCEECGSTNNIEVHHIDKNPRNSHPSNLKMLCVPHHKAWHFTGAKAVFKDTISSIKFIGDRETYDLEMESPNHNYVANGLVVHNSQESQRYCNYSLDKFGEDVVFVKPVYLQDDLIEDWRASCLLSETAYLRLIDLGMTAEEARAVLPNCTKTELMMTATLTAWRHFFEVRCDHHAQLPIRLLATDLLKQMTALIPVVFDDLYEKFVGEDVVR